MNHYFSRIKTRFIAISYAIAGNGCSDFSDEASHANRCCVVGPMAENMILKKLQELEILDGRIGALSHQYATAQRWNDVAKSKFLARQVDLARRERARLLERLSEQISVAAV